MQHIQQHMRAAAVRWMGFEKRRCEEPGRSSGEGKWMKLFMCKSVYILPLPGSGISTVYFVPVPVASASQSLSLRASV
jgi:hypothetical protein